MEHVLIQLTMVSSANVKTVSRVTTVSSVSIHVATLTVTIMANVMMLMVMHNVNVCPAGPANTVKRESTSVMSLTNATIMVRVSRCPTTIVAVSAAHVCRGQRVRGAKSIPTIVSSRCRADRIIVTITAGVLTARIVKT